MLNSPMSQPTLESVTGHQLFKRLNLSQSTSAPGASWWSLTDKTLIDKVSVSKTDAATIKAKHYYHITAQFEEELRPNIYKLDLLTIFVKEVIQLPFPVHDPGA